MTDSDISKIFSEQQYLRMLINHIDEPIWLVDTDCTIISCNRAFRAWVFNFIGIELNIGDNVLFNGLNQLYLEKFEMCYYLALKGKEFKSVEDVQVNNEIRYTSVSFNPVFDEDKKVVGVSCIARDITEHRKHLMKIEAQNTALREIAFIESHKVRSPVAKILGLEQLFNYDDPADPLNGELLEAIAQSTRELDAIIREVVQKSNDIGLQP